MILLSYSWGIVGEKFEIDHN